MCCYSDTECFVVRASFIPGVCSQPLETNAIPHIRYCFWFLLKDCFVSKLFVLYLFILYLFILSFS